MKLVSGFILSFIIFLSSFQSSLIIVDYQINKDFYELHCTNKDKPEMDCHGKCQMKKTAENSPETFQFLKICYDFNYIPVQNPEKISIPFLYFINKKVDIASAPNLLKGHPTLLNPPPIS